MSYKGQYSRFPPPQGSPIDNRHESLSQGQPSGKSSQAMPFLNSETLSDRWNGNPFASRDIWAPNEGGSDWMRTEEVDNTPAFTSTRVTTSTSPTALFRSAPGPPSNMYNSRDRSDILPSYDSQPSSRRTSQESYHQETDSRSTRSYSEFLVETTAPTRHVDQHRNTGRYHAQRKLPARDEFDGPHQFLPSPSRLVLGNNTDIASSSPSGSEMPHLPTHLTQNEQESVLSRINEILSACAFSFVARYQFPIPLEADKAEVRMAADRDWTEWAYLLKRLATKRRIPARLLYNGQIKQLVTTLDNSLEARHSPRGAPRPLRDDRYLLQMVSAATQVARLLKDAGAVVQLDRLYITTDALVLQRCRARGLGGGF